MMFIGLKKASQRKISFHKRFIHISFQGQRSERQLCRRYLFLSLGYNLYAINAQLPSIQLDQTDKPIHAC